MVTEATNQTQFSNWQWKIDLYNYTFFKIKKEKQCSFAENENCTIFV